MNDAISEHNWVYQDIYLKNTATYEIVANNVTLLDNKVYSNLFVIKIVIAGAGSRYNCNFKIFNADLTHIIGVSLYGTDSSIYSISIISNFSLSNLQASNNVGIRVVYNNCTY